MRVFFLGLLVFHEFGFGSSKTGKCTPKKLEITSMNIDDHLGFHGADACFDGNLDNFCHSGTSAAKSIFSHPASEGKLSLWLTLNRIEDISYVRIYNRKGCCQDRFGAHQIQLSTDRGHNWDSTCFTGVLPSNDGPTDEACVGTADTLRLLQTTPNWIHLAEVEVYGGCGPIRCSPGTFKDGAACTNCTVGQYQEDYDKTSCKNCPVGKFAVAAGASSCVPCLAGKFAQAGGCTNCPTGKYSELNSLTACKGCITGTYQDEEGQTGCKECTRGQHQDQTGQTGCKGALCPEGTVAPACPGFCVSTVTCKDCPAGSYNDQLGRDEGVGGCKICPVGKYSGALPAPTNCTHCAAGKSTLSTGAHVIAACDPCLAGKYSTASGTPCTLCTFGRFQNDTGQFSCKDCQPGQYQDEEGKDSCKDCAAGTFGIGVARTACKDCQPGQHQDQLGQPSCKNCAAGKFADGVGQGACKDCPLGRDQPATGLNLCDPCRPGQYADQLGQPSCKGTLCPAGKYHPVEEGYNPVACTLCEWGKAQNQEGQTECRDCGTTIGAGLGKVRCETCPIGTYYSAVAPLSCLSCPAGKYKDSVASDYCEDCAVGQYQNDAGQPRCKFCDTVGTENTYQDQRGKSGCKDYTTCPKGYGVVAASRAPTQQLSCEPCPFSVAQNKTSSFNNDVDFTPCHRYTTCMDSPLSAATRETPSLCARDAASGLCTDGIEIGTRCEPQVRCRLGQRRNNTANTCINCAAGHFNEVENADTCRACTGAVGAASTCACRPGQADSTNRTNCALLLGGCTCVDCPAGKFSQYGAECVACPAGKHNTEGGLTLCDDCPHHTFSAEGEASCTPCVGDSFTAVTGADACIECPAGYERNSGAIPTKEELDFHQCLPTDDLTLNTAPERTHAMWVSSLPEGAYAFACNMSGPDVAPKPIEGGFSSTVHSYCRRDLAAVDSCAAKAGSRPGIVVECEECAKGYFLNSNTGSCDHCPAGKYGDQPGSLECKDCPEHKYQDYIARESCKSCVPGRYRYTEASGLANCPDVFPFKTGPQQCHSNRSTSSAKCGSLTIGPLVVDSMQLSEAFPTFPASKCNDGKVDTFCHTKYHTGPRWLMATFAKPMYVRSVIIEIRRGCTGCDNLVGDHVIELSNDASSWAECFTGTFPTGIFTKEEACVGTAKHVRLRKTADDSQYLNISEMQVSGFSCPAPTNDGTRCYGPADGCEPGRYALPMTTPQTYPICKECPSGEYQDQTGQSDCKGSPCLPNTYFAAGQVATHTCTNCSAGQHQDQVGQSSCKNITGGVSPSFSSLPLCGIGSGLNDTTFLCENCASGFYQKQDNVSRFCLPHSKITCVPGEQLLHENDATRDVRCESCPSGQFSNAATTPAPAPARRRLSEPTITPSSSYITGAYITGASSGGGSSGSFGTTTTAPASECGCSAASVAVCSNIASNPKCLHDAGPHCGKNDDVCYTANTTAAPRNFTRPPAPYPPGMDPTPAPTPAPPPLVCVAHTPICNNSTDPVKPQVTLRPATSISDRACADIVNCSTNSSVQQTFVITVDDYLSGESTWQCIGSFTGEITNPALLSAQANVTDSELGFFTTTNIVIGATGATVAVGAGVVIAGAGAGTLTAAGAATASSVLQTAQSLASKYAYTGATAESIQQNIVNNLPRGKTLDTASVSDLVQAETTALAEITNIPPAELIDQVVAADPSIAKKMGEEFTKLQETASSGVGSSRAVAEARNAVANQDAWAKGILGSATNKKTLTKIYTDAGIPTAFTAGGLSSMRLPRLPRLRVPMQSRSRAGGGPRYHRIPNNKLHL